MPGRLDLETILSPVSAVQRLLQEGKEAPEVSRKQKRRLLSSSEEHEIFRFAAGGSGQRFALINFLTPPPPPSILTHSHPLLSFSAGRAAEWLRDTEH